MTAQRHMLWLLEDLTIQLQQSNVVLPNFLPCPSKEPDPLPMQAPCRPNIRRLQPETQPKGQPRSVVSRSTNLPNI